jgi:hypothetical protein
MTWESKYKDRDLAKNPYTDDEIRVCEYLNHITKDDIGCRDDPIFFLMVSHNALRMDLDATKRALEAVRKHTNEKNAARSKQ